MFYHLFSHASGLFYLTLTYPIIGLIYGKTKAAAADFYKAVEKLESTGVLVKSPDFPAQRYGEDDLAVLEG